MILMSQALLFLLELLFCFLFLKDSIGTTITINKNPTGEEGSSGTFIECLIDLDDGYIINDVGLYSFQSNKMELIVGYAPRASGIVENTGNHLKGRVTYTNITAKSNRTELFFNNLLCEDDTDYQCRLSYSPEGVGVGQNANSQNSHLTVTVPPTKPMTIEVSHRNSSQEQQGINGYRENGDTCFIKIKNEFVNCSDVLVTCVGIAGKPPENLTVQMIVNDTIITNLTTYLGLSDSVIKDNCSIIRTASVATNLTKTGNRIKFRCAPTSLLHEKPMSIETEEVEMFYSVQVPSIVIAPENAIYPPVLLHCTSDGNPAPQYQWYKYENKGTILISSQQSLIIERTRDSGVYKCIVKNTFGEQETEVNITLKEHPTTTTSETEAEYITSSIATTHGNPNTEPIMAERQCNYVPAVLGGVFGTLGLCFMLSVVVFMWQKRSSTKAGDDPRHQMTSIPDQSLSSHYEGVSNERSDHDYTELRQRHEHPYYNTQIQSSG